jgi:hypothetical protein
MPDSSRSRRKTAAQTAEALHIASPIQKEDPVQHLLGVLYSQALEGNTTAAKLYLDYALKPKSEESSALTPEEALKLLREGIVH